MSQNSPWWLAPIQGLEALGAGLFWPVDPSAATFLVGLLAAINLLVTGLICTVRGIIGLILGGVLQLMALFNIGNLSLGYKHRYCWSSVFHQ